MNLPSLAELKALSDEDLVVKFDEHAQSTIVGTSFLIEEIRFRQMASINSSMLSLTRWVVFLTVVVTVATIANVGLFWLDFSISRGATP